MIIIAIIKVVTSITWRELLAMGNPIEVNNQEQEVTWNVRIGLIKHHTLITSHPKSSQIADLRKIFAETQTETQESGVIQPMTRSDGISVTQLTPRSFGKTAIENLEFHNSKLLLQKFTTLQIFQMAATSTTKHQLLSTVASATAHV